MIVTLRKAFGEMSLSDIEPQHIYQYVDKRSAKVSAHREIEVLSYAFTKSVEWGLLKAHPFKGQVRLEGEEPRTRYVEDWEIEEALALAPGEKGYSTTLIQAYLILKLLTGLRQRDLLNMTMSNIKEDGIHVTPSKTKNSTGKQLIYEWTPSLRAAIDKVIAARPVLSPYLFCNSRGECFVNPKTDEARGWQHIWQDFMAKLLKETKIKERFTEHDLRAKVASDADSLERAQQLMAHSESGVTQRVYRRKPERIKPAK